MPRGAKPVDAGDAEDDSPPGRVRLDKWLWAARFFKTRALAAEAIDGGKITVNEDRPKRARLIQAGDEIRVRLGPYEHRLTVIDVAGRRGSAAVAQSLYEESAESVAARHTLSEQHRLSATSFAHHEGRPSKKDRRAIAEVRRRH
jgi:ribosome-associated heat shock protein Hsp15